MTIKPAWKKVSELQNMTYEEWLAIGRGDLDDTDFLIQRKRDAKYNSYASGFYVLVHDPFEGETEEDFMELKPENKHVCFQLCGGGIVNLDDIVMFFEIPKPFDVAPPEEE